MRKHVLLALLAAAVTLPLQAVQKSESYVSYDDGGTIIRAADDGREIESRVNLPVFPGDEIITNRRGRAEVRLADGNFLAIDRATLVRLHSVLGSYDDGGNATDTIVELKYGKVAVDRSGSATEAFRLDTAMASYFAGEAAVFSVTTDESGRDHVSVFDGEIEVRTPSRSSRMRAGESASVDNGGAYDLSTETQNSADDFERWFLARTDHYSNSDSRYLDSSLAYYDDQLAEHGTWQFIGSYGWAWRPYVNAGWRPYFYGQWVRGRSGCLTWVSYEPWGWVPYHYGRWAFDPLYGWFWMPGETYSPAWVYWWYSPGYVGWAPAGWYDCYRPYYDWAYRPYRGGGLDIGFGFYGRVHVHEVDLRPWTFIDAHTILSTRIDRAAIATDVVRTRLVREGGGAATISATPARFTRRDLQDPAGAVNAIYRRGMEGSGSQPAPDLTPFFARDPELPVAIKDRLVRTRLQPVPAPAPAPGIAPVGGSGGLAPIGSGGLAPIGRGNVAPIGSGSLAPIPGSTGTVTGDGHVRRDNPNTGTAQPATGSGSTSGGHINRGTTPPKIEAPKQETNPPKTESPWRSRAVRPPSGGDNTTTTPPASTTAPPPPSSRSNWRSGDVPPSSGSPAGEQPPARIERQRAVERGSDVPRRVIDGIGGARLAPRTPPPATTAPPPPPPRHESGGSHHESGSSSKSSSSSSSSSGHSESKKQ